MKTLNKDKQVYIELWVHFKQGDDLGHLLEHIKKEEPNKTPLDAISLWAEGMKENAKLLEKGVAIIRQCGVEIEDIQSDVHFIEFGVNEIDYGKLEKSGLFELGLFSRAAWQDDMEDDDWDDDIEPVIAYKEQPSGDINSKIITCGACAAINYIDANENEDWLCHSCGELIASYVDEEDDDDDPANSEDDT